MSSANAKHRVPQSANPFNRNDRSTINKANAIMVNSDIMILHGNRQGSPSECEDDNYQTASSGRSDTAHSHTPDSLSLEQLPLPPSHPGTVSEPHPYSPYHKNNTSSSSAPAHSTSTGPYRPSPSNQQHSLNSSNNNNNVYQRSNDHEMQERNLAMSPSLSSISTILTSRTIEGAIGPGGNTSRRSTDNENSSPASKYQATNNKSNNYNPVSHKAKAASRLMADTPDTQSASGSKNDLIYDKHNTAHLKNDMVPEKSHGYARTGVPGKNGEEPETDMFNFVHIMLNMPEEPTWKQVIIKLFKVLAVMTISYFGLMSLYFAAEFQSDSRLSNFNVLVVDLDQGIIGNNYLNFTSRLNNQPGQLNWSIEPANLYPNISTIKEQVMNGNYWGAVVVQANASLNLYNAFAIPLPDYDPTQAFAFIYDGGRDPLVVKPYIVATMYTQFLVFSKFFNPAWIKFILAYSESKNFTINALQSAPQVLGTPVAFEEFDLHPLTATIITSATSVAYIWIFLVAGGSTYLVTHMVQPMTRHASVLKTMICMLLPLLMFLVTLSLAYSALLPVFGVPFADGAPQFFKLFGGMLLLQCSVAAMVLFLIFLIPVVFIPSITITFVILNVIAVFNPVELMPLFYRWVYAMPFLNAVQISRFVLMGSYNRLKYNIPVLSAWIMLPIVLMPFAIARQKRLAKEARIREEEERLEEEFLSRTVRGQRHIVEDGHDTHRTDDCNNHGAVKRNESKGYYYNNEYEELHKRYIANQSQQTGRSVNMGSSGVADTQYSAPSEPNVSSRPKQSRRNRDPYPNDIK
ncbi:hypothetical protein BGX26_007582 [Mortierella sp. AD094]|nr:hypothetical protein BGX26_007582 [Mortierella sp. AD094]